MISFLTSAKSFDGPARQIQLKAIRSWMRLDSDVEIFLYGIFPTRGIRKKLSATR